LALADICDLRDAVARRILASYGAIFVASPSVEVPPTCLFADQHEVYAYQDSTASDVALVTGVEARLQTAAMNALQLAVEASAAAGRSITPRRADAATRSYEMTVDLWLSRVQPGLDHWHERGRLSDADVARISALPGARQVREILAMEDRGLWCGTSLSRTILASVAAPGASQHLSMLALDVSEHGDRAVREILARYGWFQTVADDLPHFTFLGLAEASLPGVGLHRVMRGDRVYWVPDLDP